MIKSILPPGGNAAQAADPNAEQMLLLAAEHELGTIEIIAGAALSPIAQDRIAESVETIRTALRARYCKPRRQWAA